MGAPTPAASAEARRLFDIAGAVEYLRSIGATSATVSFVRGLISSGQLPYLKIGKRFCVSRGSLDSWIDRHERRAKP